MTQTSRFRPKQTAKMARGLSAYHGGLAAEETVSRVYAQNGLPTLAKRWRGASGELDLVVQNDSGVVVIEVKKSKSHGRAAARVSARQLSRICGATVEFLETQPKGQLTEVRVDVALVDEIGHVEVIENVTMAT